jgi:hypothetical protein
MAKTPAKSPVTTSARLRRLVLPVIVGLLIITAVIQGCCIVYLVRQNDAQDKKHLGQLIVRAVDERVRSVPQDPRSGAVFIAEAGLTLPAIPANLGQLVYTYTPAMDDTAAVLNIARQSDMNYAKLPLLSSNGNVDDMFDAVPRFQACSRGLTITADKLGSQVPAGSKVLGGGTTLHIYAEPLCTNKDLLAYALQIDSYR